MVVEEEEEGGGVPATLAATRGLGAGVARPGVGDPHPDPGPVPVPNHRRTREGTGREGRIPTPGIVSCVLFEFHCKNKVFIFCGLCL